MFHCFQLGVVNTVFPECWLIGFERLARLILWENTITFIDSSFQIDRAFSHQCSNIQLPFPNKLQWDDNTATNAKTLFKGYQSLAVSASFRAPGDGAERENVVSVLHVSAILGTTESQWVSYCNDRQKAESHLSFLIDKMVSFGLWSHVFQKEKERKGTLLSIWIILRFSKCSGSVQWVLIYLKYLRSQSKNLPTWRCNVLNVIGQVLNVDYL